MASVYRSTYAGEWYPADPQALHALLTRLFRSAEERARVPAAGARQVAFIVPHAGPVYSGVVSAAAFRRLSELKPRRVVILGFLHSGLHHGILIADVSSYQTPLGTIAVDEGAARELLRSRSFTRGGATDHSVELQLPFLQFTVPETVVVPIYVGSMEGDERTSAAKAVACLLDDNTVLLASTDFTHYGRQFGFMPFPVDDHTADRLRALDMCVIDAIGALDMHRFRDALRETQSTMCGVHPVALLMEVLRAVGRGVAAELLDYQTSGEIEGNYRASVSYAAIGFGLRQEGSP